MCQKHPDVRKYGTKIDLSDLEADSDVMFQDKHYGRLVLLLGVVLPTVIPWLLWSENLVSSYFLGFALRILIQYHGTWSINSVAHFYGMKPFDK